MSEEQFSEAHDLIMGVLDERLTPEQSARLDELVRQDVEVRKLYIMYVHQRCVIATMGRPVELLTDLDMEIPAERSLDDTMVVRAIPFEQMLEVDEELLLSPPSIERRPEEVGMAEALWRIRKYLIAAIVLLVVSVTLILVMRGGGSAKPEIAATAPTTMPVEANTPAPPVPAGPVYVARLERQIGARWSGVDHQPAAGEGFEAYTHLVLATGLAEVKYATGTSVIFEGPADITIENNAVDMPDGKLAATVPARGRGFAVRTRQSTVIDLGTELGVDAEKSGTEVDVFKGKVTAKTLEGSATPVLLSAGKAASVANGKVAMETQGAMVQKFVRELHTDATSLDVVDLVAGGIGTTHQRGAGIDLRSGKYGAIGAIGTVKSDEAFHAVNLPVVDGCFIPKGLIKIDSSGDRYDFGKASGRSYGGIHAGNPIVWQPGAPGDPQFTATMGGVDYTAAGHGFLLMHASSGLTFNLDAIRRLCPDKKLTVFHAMLGNTAQWTRPRKANAVPHTSALVLVDGKVRGQRMDFTYGEGPMRIEATLADGDKFLTLATVEKQTDTEYDWIIFGDPAIECGAK